MISHKHQCIFIHIPKCAGTSIEAVLGHLQNHIGRGGQDHRSIRMIEQPYLRVNSLYSKENFIELVRRSTYERFRKQLNYRNDYIVNKKQYDEYFKFTFVRNPWARAYSCYKNVMRDPIHCKKFNISGELYFNDFIKRYAGRGLLRTQLYWIKNFQGSIPLDYIGRFENLTEDMKIVFSNLKSNDLPLPHKLQGTVDDFRDHYDKETIDLIHEIYNEEIELFHYSFS